MADWEANVRRVVPYTPGEQPKRNDIIKLNTNECPYPPAPGVTKALQEFEADKLRLYPDPAALELREAIAAAVSARFSLTRQIKMPFLPAISLYGEEKFLPMLRRIFFSLIPTNQQKVK